MTQVITTCDADDPACTFQTSSRGFNHGKWVSNLNTRSDRQMEVHVRSDLRQGSSYEDDIGEGRLAGLHKTDEMGKFHEWTPRPQRFREREYSRVRVGVPDADGMDSWQHWRREHPDRPGHGNLPPHPSQYPTTSHDVVFRGPISQPREVAPVDQNYDLTDENALLPETSSEGVPATESSSPSGSFFIADEGAAGAARDAAAMGGDGQPQYIIKNGKYYLAVPVNYGGAVAAPAPAPSAAPLAVSGTSPDAPVGC